MTNKRIIETAQALARGTTSSVRLAEGALELALDPSGEGARVFIRIYREAARAEAAASHRLRGAGIVPSPIAGIPISIKDLFDVAGETTTAGSVVLQENPPAAQDALIVRRLRAAGAVIVGKTNMTEFAYSGVGLNPHYGTPRNRWERPNARIPGGSSSGAAISITDGMAIAAIGTDTGGSVRIPAALNGLVGYKPTARRVPRDGAFPLSTTLDSIGPIANSLACCAILDAVLAGDEPVAPDPMPLHGLRLGLAKNYVLDGLDAAVERAFESALRRLSDAGARIIGFDFPELEQLPSINANGGFSAAESYSNLRALVAAQGERIDPRVLARIVRGAEMSGADYVDLLSARASLIANATAKAAPFDALVMPTVAITAPKIAELSTNEDYARINLKVLRNPSVVNFLDRCALTLPCHEPGEAPVGLSLIGEHMGDRRLISIGLACEAVVRRE